MQTNQGSVLESIRAITGTTLDYNGDWHSLFDVYQIPSGDYNGRLILWLQSILSSTSTNINELKQLYATSLGFYNWGCITYISPFTQNLSVWYDLSNNKSTITSGTAITRFIDLSGNNFNTDVQVTASARPTLTPNQQNGKYTAVFDGGDTLALPSSVYSLANDDNTIFVVSNRATEAGTSNSIIDFSESGVDRLALTFAAVSGRVAYLSSTTIAGVLVNNGNTNTNYQIIRGKRSSATQTLAVNGGTATTNANGANENGVDAAFIGSLAGSSQFLTGGIAEILIYNRALTVAESTQNERYLASKWGITLS